MKMGTTAGGINFLLGEEEKFKFSIIKREMSTAPPNRDMELAAVYITLS